MSEPQEQSTPIVRPTPVCNRDEGGFTMMELLVTMVLLAIVLTGLAALQLSVIKQVTVSSRAAEATRLAQLVMQRYESMPYATLAAFSPKGTWFPELRRDGVTTMANVGTNGENDGPFIVESLHETSNGAELVVVRVRWTNITRGLEADATRQYREFDVTMGLQRYQ